MDESDITRERRGPGVTPGRLHQWLLERREQFLRDGPPPELAREGAVAETVQAFAPAPTNAAGHVEDRRIASLASDTLGLKEEYRDQHGYSPDLAPPRMPSVRSWKATVPAGSSPCSSPCQVALEGRPAPAARPRPPAAGAGADASGRGRPAMNGDRPDPG
jgi:hypothetical protein